MTVATPLEVADIRSRIQERREAETQAEIDYIDTKYKFIKPLSVAANGLIEYVQNPEGRFMLGLHEIDIMTRGIGRGELAYITGQSHQGKTQLVLNAIVNNPDRLIVLFTPDEVAELVLAKIVAIRNGVNSEQLEARIKAHDREVIEMVRRAASIEFSRFIVIDDPLTFQQMRDALTEASDYHQQPVDAAVIDFFELVRHNGDVEQKNATIKQWTKDVNASVLCLRQSHMSEAKRGQSGGFFTMRYGGHSEATQLIEVYRPRDDESLSQRDRELKENVVVVNLTKNKRPPCKIGRVEYYLNPETGLIRPVRSEDWVASGASTSDALTAVRAVNR